MLKRFELPLYLAVVAVLAVALVAEGRTNAALSTQAPLAPKDLYRQIATSKTTMQIVDVRTDREEYEDTHVPGAIPFPGCDPSAVAPEVQARILPYVPTVVVSESGSSEDFARCREAFAYARNLEGGIEGWSDENLPEDSGEYVPPRPGAGGGCL